MSILDKKGCRLKIMSAAILDSASENMAVEK
jgi:hypothetical protein